MKVLVYGATGAQATPTVSELLAQGHEAIVFTRDAAKAETQRQAGATIFEGDMLDADATRRASEGVDAVALLIPFFMGDPQAAGKNAVQAAKEAGVKLVVWNTSGPLLPQRVGQPAMDARLDVRDWLRESGLPHIILQPTVYAENLLGPWTRPFVAERNQVAYPTPPDFTSAWLPAADMGKLVVAALQRPELADQHFVVSGRDTVNGPQLAEVFSRALGREISYYAMPPQEFGQILDQAFGPGAGTQAAAEYQRIWDGEAKPVMAVDMQPVLEALPVELMPLEEWVRQRAAAFTATEKQVK